MTKHTFLTLGLAGTMASFLAVGVASATHTDPGTRSTAPAFNPAAFTNPVQNPYFPLTPGLLTHLRGTDGEERFLEKVRVTHRTKLIAGVSAVVVRDVVRQRAMAKGLEQCGHQLAPGKIAGAAEQDEVKTHETNFGIDRTL